ncbi:MAG: 3'(2'),5'-bisphosphate nucleotidase CysQ, partial [Eudoraea sp.]
MNSTNQTITIAVEAAVQAGVAILKVYHSASFSSELKEDNSPLTEADKAASLIINKQLQSTNIPIINEE